MIRLFPYGCLLLRERYVTNIFPSVRKNPWFTIANADNQVFNEKNPLLAPDCVANLVDDQ